MHDAVTFERAGMPAAAICTEPFITSGVAMAKIGGIPDYPFAVMDHPLGSLDQQTLKEKAREITPRIIEILVQGI